VSIPFKKWKLHAPAPERLARQVPHVSPVVVQVLYNRGLRDPGSIRDFWESRFDFDNPYQLKGLADAVQRIRMAIRRRECIAVYGDFDVDGVTSSVVMAKVLDALGARFIPYIPHRIDEGYGLNKRALKLLHDKGCSLVVTVDCGIRSVAEVAYARRLGMDVVLTDHHSIGPEIPPANAVVNPKQKGDRYPFKDLAGVGVSYKLAQGLLRAERQVPLRRREVSLTEEDLLDLVALGTVADIVPLVGENRALVARGLASLNDPHRPGLLAMMQEAGVKPGQVTAMTIGFVLGPRLNAAGRLDTARLSYDLLCCHEVVIARAEYLVHRGDGGCPVGHGRHGDRTSYPVDLVQPFKEAHPSEALRDDHHVHIAVLQPRTLNSAAEHVDLVNLEPLR